MKAHHALQHLASLGEAEQLFPPRRQPAGAEVVRIAPSPTGFPHIGTALQAVINRALARKTMGRFLLRIEDTDRARLVPGAEEAILEALRWLDLVPDEGPDPGGDYGPYRQSERLPLYRLAAGHLLAEGRAYHCFCTPERLESLRRERMKDGKNPRYDRKCLSLTPDEVKARLEAGEAGAIRFLAPDGGEVSFFDEVRGEITFGADAADDPIILKSDGYPTYHLASVVDDHFMRITTVVRGEEWISSTPKHILLYRAFAWNAPRFLHTVVLRDEQRHKLSKRSGHTSLSWFRAQGYLAEGFRNFLTRILWPHPREKDIYDFAEFVSLFNVQSLPRTGPVVDMKLLDFINGQYLKALTPGGTAAAFSAYLEQPDIPEEGREAGPGDVPPALRRALRDEIAAFPAYAERVFSLEPERNRKFSDVFANNGFFFESAFTPAPPESFRACCPDGGQARQILRAVLGLHGSEPDHEEWDAAMRQIAQDFAVKPKAVFMLSRLAVTGREKTPPLYEILVLLGPERVRKRLERAMEILMDCPENE